MELGLQGKVALVTGAGSQIGFGRCIALLLAKEGCDSIVINDINLDDAEKTTAELKEAGCKSIAVKADITKKAEVQDMVKKVIAEYGKIDLLFNVAGAVLGTGPLEEQQEDLWDREISLNLYGAMLVSQAVLPYMKKQNSRQINRSLITL